MFNGASSYASLTTKVMAMGTGGLMMPTQSNPHESDNDDLFPDTSNNYGEVAGYKWVVTYRCVIDYSFS